MQADDGLRKYLSLISPPQGGIESLLAQVDQLTGRSGTAGFGCALEAIIDAQLRPAFDVDFDTFVTNHLIWERLARDPGDVSDRRDRADRALDFGQANRDAGQYDAVLGLTHDAGRAPLFPMNRTIP